MTLVSTGFAGTARYALIREIGRGGFGTVYETYDQQRDTVVALKVLRSAEGVSLLRFKREFRLLAEIDHPHLVNLYEFQNVGPHWFFTMALVKGQTILDYVRRPAAGPGTRRGHVERLRAVMPQLIGALATLHEHRIIHCDIKPSNVLVDADGHVTVLDFGLLSEYDQWRDADESGALASALFAGTAAYMAPDQDARPTPAADWYSVGVVLYEMLTGRRPFAGTLVEQLEAKRATRPTPPAELDDGIPRELSDVCMALLEPERPRRAGKKELTRAFAASPVPPATIDPVAGDDDLIGREDQLDALADAFEAVERGQTLLALVSGPSGMGKSALLQRFIADQRTCTPDLILLAGRCYEHESMPYKAIDPIVDALSRYLQRLPNIEVARLLPRDAGILTRLFPVLKAVDEFSAIPAPAIDGLDAVTLRGRAAAALGDLLFKLADRPVILAIDDAQWGDADSAVILQQVLRSVAGSRLLLIAAWRSEDAGRAPLVTALTRAAAEPDGPQAVQLTVGPLNDDDTRLLVSRFDTDDATADTVAAIVRESQGSPFFVHELVRHAATFGGSTRLDAVVREHVLSLPETARNLIATVAVSSQPIPAAVAEAASPNPAGEGSPLKLLRSSRLVRGIGGSSGTTVIEPYHDRIREAVVAHLSSADLAACHRRLADAWEQSGLARPDTLATHYAGAGDDYNASVYAEEAADVASRALAFDRAAEYYRLLLRLNARQERRRQWLVGLGESLVSDGRGYEAANAYFEALSLTEPGHGIDLECRAAAELIRSGYLPEAMAALERLLPRVGITPIRTHLQAIGNLVAYRTLIALRGIEIDRRTEAEVPREQLQAIDVLVAIGAPLSLIALPLGLALNMQATWRALRAGEPKRAALGLALLAATQSMRGTRTEASVARVVRKANQLAAEQGDRYTTARTLLAEGIWRKVCGYWVEGIRVLERAVELFARCPGSRWEIETAQTLIHDALIWTGDWKRLAAEIPVRRDEAARRGDRFSAAHVAGRLAPFISLVADRPAQARAEAEAAVREASRPHYNLQARAALCAWLDIELYDGQPQAAQDRFDAAWPSQRGTIALFQGGRIEAHFYRARIALALHAQGAQDALPRAIDAARRLDREQAAWATALARLARAGVARAQGRDADAAVLLDEAERLLTACDMRLYAAAAAFRRSQLIGTAGESAGAAALEKVYKEGAVAPRRVMDLLCPGAWDRPTAAPDGDLR